MSTGPEFFPPVLIRKDRWHLGVGFWKFRGQPLAIAKADGHAG